MLFIKMSVKLSLKITGRKLLTRPLILDLRLMDFLPLDARHDNDANEDLRGLFLTFCFRLRLHGIGNVQIRLGSDPLCLRETGSELERYGST